MDSEGLNNSVVEREIYYLKHDKRNSNRLNVYDSFVADNNITIGYLDENYNFRENDSFQKKNFMTSYPFITKNKLPSYKELINSIPEYLKNKSFCMGYLKKNKYNNYYIMEIIVWDYYFDNDFINAVYKPKIIPDVNNKIKRLYEKVKVLKLEKNLNGQIEVYIKPTPSLTGVAYMWEWDGVKKFFGIYENGKIKKNNGKIIQLVEDKPTIHSYAYHGFFKPDINEVLNSINYENFMDKDKFYITTEIFSNDISKVVIGGHHIGITRVFI